MSDFLHSDDTRMGAESDFEYRPINWRKRRAAQECLSEDLHISISSTTIPLLAGQDRQNLRPAGVTL